MHRDIHRAKCRCDSLNICNMGNNPLCNGYSPGGDSGNHKAQKIVVLLDDLVGNATQCLADGF